MKTFLTALAFVGSLHGSCFADASKIEYKIHVIYAGDQSASMRHPPSWMRAQQHYLTEYFANYSSRCQELHIDYVGWGSEAIPALQAVLRTNADGKEFSELLYQLTYQNLKATVQHEGMVKALSLVTDGYDRTVVVFVSEEFMGGEDDAELWKLVPPDVEFIGISLGYRGSDGYFKRHIVPPTVNGKHYHAYTRKQFGEILYTVFDSLGNEHCLAG